MNAGVNSDRSDCIDNWYGVHCDIYLGDCPVFCAYCPHGDAAKDCEKCAYGAWWNPTLDEPICECMSGYAPTEAAPSDCAWSA